MDISIIRYIKETEKKIIALAAMEGMDRPVIYKELPDGNYLIYEKIKSADSEYFPKIYFLEKEEGCTRICEEYVPGQPLNDYLNLHELDTGSVFRVAFQLCDALNLLHSQTPPIIHRDIKPENIIIGNDYKVTIVDFDISRVFKPEGSESDTRLLGTVSYAAPEQFGYSQTDMRSDIYSLGIVLKQLMAAVPGEIPKRIAKKYQKMVSRCTSFDPDDRYSSVDALKKALSRLYSGYKCSENKKVRLLLCGACGLLAAGVIAAAAATSGGGLKPNNTETLELLPEAVSEDGAEISAESDAQSGVRVSAGADGKTADYFTADSFSLNSDIIISAAGNKNQPDCNFVIKSYDGKPIPQLTIEFSIPKGVQLKSISYANKTLKSGTGTLLLDPPYPGAEKPAYEYTLTDVNNRVNLVLKPTGSYKIVSILVITYDMADGKTNNQIIDCKYDNPYQMHSNGPGEMSLDSSHVFSVWDIIDLNMNMKGFCERVANGTILVLLSGRPAVPVLEDGVFKGKMKTDSNSDYITVYDTELKCSLYSGNYKIEVCE